ncbi:MAG: 3-octaprenyl-4-hydroxybenzoate carboxy-lyase [Bacteroidetes bacterium]|nr:MAG: 3-octaprenyl-4-hydroxybenzoate carboxy-lyase [Bacteroidota bacterium]
MIKKNIIVAVSGASGAIYTKLLFDKLNNNKNIDVSVVFSNNAKEIWKHELDNADLTKYKFSFFDNDNFYAPFASGSAKFDTMIIIPSSMGIIGRISNGVSNDLITRAADVMLKERRKLIIVSRETPYNLIHIENLKKITLAGGIICPASPSFYSKPQTIEQLALTVIERVLDLSGIKNISFRWGE